MYDLLVDTIRELISIFVVVLDAWKIILVVAVKILGRNLMLL